MRFDPYASGGPRPTLDNKEAAGVRRAAAIYAAGQPGSTPTQTSGVPAQGEARPHVSPLGQLLRDLHGIRSNDPNAFSNVTATIANRLHEMAAQEPSDEASEHIHRLAERFSLVSQTGNLAVLRPTEAAPRALHGPAAYANQRQREETRELRVEVQTAIDDVLQPFMGAATADPVENPVGDPYALQSVDLDVLEPGESSPRTLSVTG